MDIAYFSALYGGLFQIILVVVPFVLVVYLLRKLIN